MTNMSVTAKFDLRSIIENTVLQVFEIMLGFTAVFDPDNSELIESDRLSGTIKICGETVTGEINIHLPEALATQFVNAMLGNPASQPVEDMDMNDVIGEIANMIGGGLKSALGDAGHPCSISTPSVTRGPRAVEAPGGLHTEVFYFTCQGSRLMVEVHLKLD